MPAFLLTGNPGSGKTTVAHALEERGVRAIDPDSDPELSYWEDRMGTRVDRPRRPDEEWLGQHRWVWSRSRLQAVLGDQIGVVFVCGIARNQDQLLDLFEQTYLLHIDAETQEARLAAYDALNPPGRSEAGRQEIRDGRELFEEQMLRLGAIALDGRAATSVITDRLLALVAGG